MPRYDIARIRKENGISQNELAQRLQITQSFLSAIENGRSPLPIEKEEKLREIFPKADLSLYVLDKKDEEDKRVIDMTDSDLFNQLLSRFHRQAHSSEENPHRHIHHEKIQSLEEQVLNLFTRNDSLMKRNDALMERNDRLSEANDRLRAENDALRSEIDRLRSQIFSLKS
ncbi:MAG: helix-turn-helix domain-containing protein [Muribaculaceae bacterium]|nr:helix-turn-helix domain-containing protein [Muribaculaceae bacterium]